jgi:hypothetical protein
MHSLGGSLGIVYWEVSARAVHAIVDLPDSSTAAAAAGVLSQTGAFKSIEVEEVLTQTQFTEVLALAGNVFETFRVPGQAMLDDDSSRSRSGVRGLLRTLSANGTARRAARSHGHPRGSPSRRVSRTTRRLAEAGPSARNNGPLTCRN